MKSHIYTKFVDIFGQLHIQIFGYNVVKRLVMSWSISTWTFLNHSFYSIRQVVNKSSKPIVVLEKKNNFQENTKLLRKDTVRKKKLISTSIKTGENLEDNINWNNYFIKQLIPTCEKNVKVNYSIQNSIMVPWKKIQFSYPEGKTFGFQFLMIDEIVFCLVVFCFVFVVVVCFVLFLFFYTIQNK